MTALIYQWAMDKSRNFHHETHHVRCPPHPFPIPNAYNRHGHFWHCHDNGSVSSGQGKRGV